MFKPKVCLLSVMGLAKGITLTARQLTSKSGDWQKVRAELQIGLTRSKLRAVAPNALRPPISAHVLKVLAYWETMSQRIV